MPTSPAVPDGAFDFLCAGRIAFGCGRADEAGAIAAEFGRRALLVTNAGEPGDGGPVDRLVEALSAAGVTCSVLAQRGEPTVADIERVVAAARSVDCDVVVGLGGGSALDAAKATAALLTNAGGPLDYIEVVGLGRKITRPAAPWIALPTTAGTGAEVTKNAVIACPDHQVKASIRGEQLLARAVVVDPELAISVPPDVTAAAGMDALCQLIESYTSARAQPMTDALVREGLGRAARSLRRAVADSADLLARGDLALAAMLSGIALTNAGLGAAHGFAGPLGGRLAAPHGAICAALLPGVMRANVEALRAESPAHPAAGRYAAVGRMLTGRADLGDADAIDAGIAFVANLANDLPIRPLGEMGLTVEAIPAVIAQARKSSSMRYNPVALSDEAMAGILAAAI